MMSVYSARYTSEYPVLKPFYQPTELVIELELVYQRNVECLEKKNYVRQLDQTTSSTLSSNYGA